MKIVSQVQDPTKCFGQIDKGQSFNFSGSEYLKIELQSSHGLFSVEMPPEFGAAINLKLGTLRLIHLGSTVVPTECELHIFNEGESSK